VNFLLDKGVEIWYYVDNERNDKNQEEHDAMHGV